MDVQSVAPAPGATDGSQAASPAEPVGPSQTGQAGSTPSATQANSGTQSGTAQASGLASAIAKLYNVAGASQNDANIGVSYKVVPGLDLVVTVFTNSDTGEEIAQFPPELLVGVAQFFDQLDGVTIDKRV